MAKLSRTKELWHIPKRGNVHQTIYMVYVLTWDKFLAKSWSSGKQEALGSEMGKAGLTENGRAITHQSVRTLLANIPKYLGFVYIDENTSPQRIMVTDIGYELINKHHIKDVRKHGNLSEYEKNNDLIETSDIFSKQMLKLIITNPSINKDCENILVFPFRTTLKLLLSLDYLDKEEIGYILFHTKKEDQYDLILEKIKTFRNLPPARREAEINAYKRSEEGQLTLVKAPTSVYYMYLCHSTGLCERTFVSVNKAHESKLPAIILADKDKVKQILSEFKDANIYDFKDNWFLWKEYFSNPKRIYPPHDVSITSNARNDIIITVSKDNYQVGSDVLSNDNKVLSVPVFRDEKYKIIVYDCEQGIELFKKEILIEKNSKTINLTIPDTPTTEVLSQENIITSIGEMFSNDYEGFDKHYYNKLKVVNRVIGKNYIDIRRKGGRLEYLFYQLLNTVKSRRVIDEVFWFGKKVRYGICDPAPGGREGNPDLIFSIDNYIFVLELTTQRGNRGQWSGSEASSVPDHISRISRENSNKKVIGIFSAPTIHHQLERNLSLNARQDETGMIFISCIELAKLVTEKNKRDLLNYFKSKVEEQLHRNS